MASFDTAVNKTLRWEGGFTIDTGGKTKFGISQNAYPSVDIPNLTLDQAKAIYKKDYWTPLKGDLITDQAAANALFDFGVNAGLGRAGKEARNALKALGYSVNDGTAIDSIVLGLINSAGASFAAALGKARISFYERLAAQDPAKYGKYLTGWKKRANDFFKLSPASGAAFLLALVLGFVIYKRSLHKGFHH